MLIPCKETHYKRTEYQRPSSVSSCQSDDVSTDSTLGELSTRFEKDGFLPTWLWHEWLWGSDPEENFHVDVLLNRNQLLGLLICRYKQWQMQEGPLLAHGHRLCLMDKSVMQMNLRELKDTLANLQLEWPVFVSRLHENTQSHTNLVAVRHLLEQCAARLGYMAENSLPETLLNDPGETRPDQDSGLSRLTSSCLRRMLGCILIMYRHFHLLGNAIELSPEFYDCGVTKYHHEASMDQFHQLYMHFQLPVAAKLNYKHDFPGMYNSVSQPVYYHNSQFQRIPREDVLIEKMTPIHLLPSLARLHPDIPIHFEEERIDPTKAAGWYWLLVPGRIYLITPEPRILHSSSILSLLAEYHRLKT